MAEFKPDARRAKQSDVMAQLERLSGVSIIEDNGVRKVRRAPPVATKRANGRAQPTAAHKMQAITNIVNLFHRGLVRADVAVSVINEIAR